MAAETNDILMIPEEAENKAAHRRRYSTGKIGSTHAKPIRSRYLGASVGSCHDICKLGGRDVTRANGKDFLPGKRASLSGSCSYLETAISGDGERELNVNPRSNTREIISKSTEGPSKIKRNQKTTLNRDARVSAPTGKKVHSPTAASKNSKQAPLAASSKNPDTKKDEGEQPNYEDMPRKTPDDIVEASEKKAEEPIQNDRASTASRSSAEGKTGSIMRTAVSPHSPRSFAKKQWSLKSPLSPKNKSKRISELWKRVAQPVLLSRSRSKVNDSDTTSEVNESEKDDQSGSSKSESKRRGKKNEAICSEDKGTQLQKAKFRRGRMIEVKVENNAPRRLKFRPHRLAGDAQSGTSDPLRTSFRKKAIDGMDGRNSKYEKVVLKHRDVEKRENVQNLFNNVIEETASKLVVTRKSKVKALVGAFETVISLQDTKPTATVSAF